MHVPARHSCTKHWRAVSATLLCVLLAACGGARQVEDRPPLSRGWSTPLDHQDHHSWAAHVDGRRLHVTGIHAGGGLRVIRLQPSSGTGRWETDVEFEGCDTPRLASLGDVTAVACESGMALLDAETGALRWRRSLADMVVPSDIAVDDEMVVVLTVDGDLLATRTASGSPADPEPDDASRAMALTTVDDVAWILGVAWNDDGDETLNAYRADDLSRTVWTMPLLSSSAGAFVYRDVVFARRDTGALRGLHIETGRPATPVWDSPGRGLSVGGLRIEQISVQGVVLAMRQLDAWGPGDEEPRWSAHLIANQDLGPFLPHEDTDGILVGGNDAWRMMDARTGALRWSVDTSDALGDDRCEFAGSDGRAVFVVCNGIEDASIAALAATAASPR